jgi:hypothetical protein
MRQMKFCPNCGSPIGNSNRFCTRCGIKFQIFFAPVPDQSLQPDDYQDHSQSAENPPSGDHQKTWSSETTGKPDNDHSIPSPSGKNGSSVKGTTTPIRSQIDKMLEDLFK